MKGQLTDQVSDMQAVYEELYYMYRHRDGQDFQACYCKMLLRKSLQGAPKQGG